MFSTGKIAIALWSRETSAIFVRIIHHFFQMRLQGIPCTARSNGLAGMENHPVIRAWACSRTPGLSIGYVGIIFLLSCGFPCWCRVVFKRMRPE